MPRTTHAATVLIAVLVALAGACSRTPKQNYGNPDEARTVPAFVPPGFKPSAAPGASATGSSGSAAASVEVPVVDLTTGRPRSDVPVRYRLESGGEARTTYTGRDGVARASVPPGVYVVDVPAGCAPRTIVGRGARGGRLGLPAGTHVRVPALRVSATRRFGAGGPVTWSTEPPWPRGTAVTFGFRLYDRCPPIGDAPNQRFDDLRYKPSGNLEVVGAVMRADGASNATVRIRCSGAGGASLLLYDPQNPSDANDLLTIRTPFAGGSWCA